MTTTEINEAIHRHLGYELVEITEMIYADGKSETKWIVWRDKDGNKTPVDSIPNYCASLDAMAIAEEFVRESSKPFSSNPNDHEPHRYFSNLIEVTMAKTRTDTVVSSCGMHMETVVLCGIDDYLLLISATAMQRAEAFLKTFDLWK